MLYFGPLACCVLVTLGSSRVIQGPLFIDDSRSSALGSALAVYT